MKKRMKKVMVLLMAAALAVPGQSLAGAAKMAVVNAQEQETKAVELQSEYFNMASRYEKVVYSKADHGFYLVKKGDPFYSNQQKFEVSFYDIDSNSYEQKTTILRAEDSFVNDEGWQMPLNKMGKRIGMTAMPRCMNMFLKQGKQKKSRWTA